MGNLLPKDIASISDLKDYINNSLSIVGYDFGWLYPITRKSTDEELIEYLNKNNPDSNRFVLLNLGEHLNEASSLINNCILKRNEIFELETIAYTKAIEYIQLILSKEDDQNLNYLNIKALFNLSSELNFNTYTSSLDARAELVESLLKTRFALHNQIGNPLNYGERVLNLREQFNQSVKIAYERLFAIKRTLNYAYSQNSDVIPSYLDIANNIYCLDFWVKKVVTTFETNSQYDYVIEKTILFTDNNGLYSSGPYFQNLINISQNDFEFNITPALLGFNELDEKSRLLGISVNILSGFESMIGRQEPLYIIDRYPDGALSPAEYYTKYPLQELIVALTNANQVAERRTENVVRTNIALKTENTTFSCQIISPLQAIPLVFNHESSLKKIDSKVKLNFENDISTQEKEKKENIKENEYYQPKLIATPVTLPNQINYGDIQPIQGISVIPGLTYYNNNFLNNTSPIGRWIIKIENTSKKNYAYFSGLDYSLGKIIDVALTFKIGIRKL